MDRNLVKALHLAWQQPAFRSGVRQAIDLEEVVTLLAALAVEAQEHQVKRSVLDLVRSALDAEGVRQAVLLTIDADDIRHHLSASIDGSLVDRPRLAMAVRSAVDDHAVRESLRLVLETPATRDLLWRTAHDQLDHRRWALMTHVTRLVVGHRSARRLVWALRRHGVLAELMRDGRVGQPQQAESGQPAP